MFIDISLTGRISLRSKPPPCDGGLHKPLAIKVFLMLFVLIFAYGSMATAGILRIKAQATVKTEHDRLQVTVKVRNIGNVPAHNVRANIVFLKERLIGPVKTLLGVDQSEAFDFEKVISGINKGRYPLTVMVDFHDANQYPFSALFGTAFYFKENVNANLLCLADNITMENKGKLRFVITHIPEKNLINERCSIVTKCILWATLFCG